MLEKEAFELPLEKQLRLLVITQEIDECRDIDELQANLKQCADSLMRYQHVCGKLAEENLKGLTTEMNIMGLELAPKTDA